MSNENETAPRCFVDNKPPAYGSPLVRGQKRWKLTKVSQTPSKPPPAFVHLLPFYGINTALRHKPL